jgi:hypothetical protein
MPLTRSRYDGHAEWYEEWNEPNAERNAAEIEELPGPGDGQCLDLGCGGEVYFAVLESARRTVLGPLGRPAALCRGRALAHPT